MQNWYQTGLKILCLAHLVLDGDLITVVSVNRQTMYAQRLGWRVYLLNLKQPCIGSITSKKGTKPVLSPLLTATHVLRQTR